jgi:hypothetical protein
MATPPVVKWALVWLWASGELVVAYSSCEAIPSESM